MRTHNARTTTPPSRVTRVFNGRNSLWDRVSQVAQWYFKHQNGYMCHFSRGTVYDRCSPRLPGNMFNSPSVCLGRPVDILPVIYICHIGTNGSRATSRLKITTISVAHSIAPPSLGCRVCRMLVHCSVQCTYSREQRELIIQY